MKKGKSAILLLIIIAVTCGLCAVSYFGVGTYKTETQKLQEAQEQAQSFELVTNEAGEIVTNEDGMPETKLVETTTSDATEAEETKKSENKGYGSAFNIKQGLDLKGGVYIVYQAEKANPTDEEMAAAIAMINGRLDAKNWLEAECQREGVDKIRVEIPGVEDAQSAVNEIGETARLTFRDEEGNVLVDGINVKDATKQTDGNQIIVQLEFDAEGTKAFADATQKNIGKPLYIMMDETVISAPTVHVAITNGIASITGNFTAQEATDLADKIRAGSLPFNLTVAEFNNVGARLGANSLSTTLFAGVIGVGIVFLFMLLIYRIAGLAADLALVIYTAIDLIIMSLFGITLTLPGIAGVVLAIGMAVDANVLIFERVREELGEGKTIGGAFKNGFSRAMPAIIDSNVTTIIASIVLLIYGTGSVKGFAQTLIIGVILSMFTAIFITKHIVEALIGIGIRSPKLYGAGKVSDKVFDIVKNRVGFIAFGVIVILVGFGFMGVNASQGKGAFNFDVQFVGGTSIEADLGQTFENDEVTALVAEATGDEAPQVQKVGTEGKTVTIKTQKLDDEKRSALVKALTEKYSIEEENIAVQEVSATLSKEMQKNAIVSVILACIAMLIYVSIRFREVKTGLSCILALLHDGLVVLGAYAVFRVPMDSAFIAAVLTVLGYSINSSVVIFDRIRENKKKYGRKNYTDLVNHSVSQTLRRSIFTSFTVFATVACLYIFGVQSVREFALPIAIGVVAGAYSSIFMSANIWHILCTAGKDKK